MKENEEKTDESTSDCRDTNKWVNDGEEVVIFDASPYPTKSIETDKLQVEKIFKEDILENSSIHKVTKTSIRKVNKIKEEFKMEEKYEEYLKELNEIMRAAKFMMLYLKDETVKDKELKNDDLENLIRIKDEIQNIAYGETICCSVLTEIEIPKEYLLK